eukprot:CAMPEP_0206613402 /NCGR_PEP_ID=MMETSP0325_2-20121206/56676_1 /ASSEMBLY_ACC=CAM_ASM_000347 /TAXON_ID=2866 /ORGANISM="Crypthecodinium cohnii, Strain Seligo" /LENGTH=67 /DNA_ID=CAMNT_0054133503 /DNA_START=652 /DNA_END=855 /DNA_ORIENTATION=-
MDGRPPQLTPKTAPGANEESKEGQHERRCKKMQALNSHDSRLAYILVTTPARDDGLFNAFPLLPIEV